MNKVDCIMLIDDDEATNFYHQMIIEEADCCEKLLIYDDSLSALSHLKDEDKSIPKIIFLDINMPIMNGWEFLEAYKKLPEKRRSKIILIMLTTSPNESDKDRSKTFDDVTDIYIKPLTESILSRALELL